MISTSDIVKPYKTNIDEVDWKAQANYKSGYNPDLYLFMKWAYKVEKGWYGFSLENAPMVWAIIIDEFLTELDRIAPNFKIHQIKLKFGGLRFYVDLNLDEVGDADLIKAIHDQIGELETCLFNEALIY